MYLGFYIFLGAMQNQHQQLFCRQDNAFFQCMSVFASAIAACRPELEG